MPAHKTPQKPHHSTNLAKQHSGVSTEHKSGVPENTGKQRSYPRTPTQIHYIEMAKRAGFKREALGDALVFLKIPKEKALEIFLEHYQEFGMPKQLAIKRAEHKIEFYYGKEE